MLKAQVSQSGDCLEPFHGRTAAFSVIRHDSYHSRAPWAIDMSWAHATRASNSTGRLRFGQLKCLVTATALQLSPVFAHLNISRQIASRKSSSGKPAVKVLMRRNSPGSPEIQ